MRDQINAFLSNDSSFGRLMTKIGIIIGANLMFVLFSLPVVTMGAAWAALCHVMLKTLRGDGVLNPFRQFWVGFRGNFKQATIVWIAALAMVAFGYADVQICLGADGWVSTIRYAIYALGALLVIVLIYLFPTMAAFENTLPSLIRSSLYFAMRKPGKLIVLLLFHVFPMVLTYSDAQDLPLYAFLWSFFGFGAIAMLSARLLLPEFKPYLPLVDSSGDFILDENGQQQKPGEQSGPADHDSHEKSEKEILEEMRKLSM